MNSTPQMAATLRDNIAELTARQRAEAQSAPLSDRIADRITGFTGSMLFVALHLLVFGLWIAINLGAVPVVPRFDPSFVVLAMVASVEAIFLSTFVLISQNRMAAAADRRADLDLHVNLLAEHELTKLAELVERIAVRLDVPVDDPQFSEIRKDIEPTQVLDALDERRREEGLEH
ncbi:DUF1003 domain-containing protein [Sphingomonas psychrotolerans]|uniref:DUF1003 domain-containing protein n=1 Tax=Sphingomonas psychrotolerans TaxID=1327635 RepID=A0ABU3MZH1_9SPHN|nr:DUF1003 domain-containing protein [Sphingomonas psychrotolerans]MDT8757693.1 DUF1003 domain-containing protein [Sphingomonas psychrotolerans]